MIMKLKNHRPGTKGAVEPVKKKYFQYSTVMIQEMRLSVVYLTTLAATQMT
jgi:hypothetical protein